MNKEIMEIIQPYMDKTLSEGCLIKYGENDFAEYGKLKISTYTEIIGHYDITAVLKYIEKENPNDDMISIDTDGEYFFMNNYGDIFPNKPLHLYTEEENNNLIKLLKKLGKQ